MSLSSNDMSVADLAAVVGGRNNDGFGFGGDGGWWILLLFILLGNGAWGNGFGFGGNGGGNGAVPYMVNTDVQRGFDQSAIMNGINGINTTVSNGFANAEISRCNSQANILATLNNNQNATTAGMNTIASALQQCLKKISNKAKEIFCFTRFETVGTLAA